MWAFVLSGALVVTTLVAGDAVCTDGYFMCATGVCIPEQFVCDGVQDCTTGDDERHCSKSGDAICTDGYFMCADGTCIPDAFVCDGVYDCAATGDDEKNCAKSGDAICTDGYFMCADGTCIPDAFVCDGVYDCAATGDDEKNCAAKSGVACEAPFQAAGDTCLYMGTDDMSWADARDYCKTLADGSDLATFPTCEQFSLATYWLNINSADGADLWVGALKASYPNNWRWTTLEELQTGVPMWAYKEGHDDGMDCASMSENFRHKLSCSVCDELKQPLCEMKSVARVAASAPEAAEILDCPSGAVQVASSCFEFSSKVEDFVKAHEECNREGRQLFHPESCDEFTHMAHYLETTGLDQSYWVGAEDVSGYHEWTWTNGDNIPGGAPFWAYDQPQHALEDTPLKYCGTMDHIVRYYLADDYCDAQHHYICRITPEN